MADHDGPCCWACLADQQSAQEVLGVLGDGPCCCLSPRCWAHLYDDVSEATP